MYYVCAYPIVYLSHKSHKNVEFNIPWPFSSEGLLLPSPHRLPRRPRRLPHPHPRRLPRRPHRLRHPCEQAGNTEVGSVRSN